MTAPRQHTHPNRRRRHTPRGIPRVGDGTPGSVRSPGSPGRGVTHVHANGIQFQCVESVPGNPVGEPATGAAARHPSARGFGSFWWSWRHQLQGMSGVRWSPSICADTAVVTNRPGNDGWTLAGDTAGLIERFGHPATLIGHADGGLVCWATSVLHSRVVKAIGLVSSPRTPRPEGIDPAASRTASRPAPLTLRATRCR